MAESTNTQPGPIEEAGPDAGNYEVIRQRLSQSARELQERAEALNQSRLEVFGGNELSLIATERVRTENNCVPRDIVSVDGLLLLIYNVFIGLKKETAVEDVFGLHRFEAREEGGFDCAALPLDSAGGFLSDPQFQKDFKNLFRYYRDARALQLVKTETLLLAVFQVGQTLNDIKVFRWRIAANGRISYVDDRGERDYSFPPQHDFEWTPVGREEQVKGRFPHLNVADTLFVDNSGGSLTVKLEDNTHTGQGAYDEPLDDPNQTLDDAQFAFARLPGIILLKVLPFREQSWRYLVYNERSRSIERIDAIGQACVRLPEDHGVLFPGGYYLQSGESKIFESEVEGLLYKRTLRAPNGEDVAYVFHRRLDGHYVLFVYNLIRKDVQAPIQSHGYSLFDDGRLVVFRAVSDEATRVHPMQVWKTPFVSSEYAARTPTDTSYLAKVGNAELVRGISDALSIARLALAQSPTRQTFEDVVGLAARATDAYYWLDHPEAGSLEPTLQAVRSTAELIIDEFEKVQAFKRQAEAALAESEERLTEVTQGLHSESWSRVEPFLEALTALRGQRGHLISLKEIRYMNLERVAELEQQAVEHFERISRDCVAFLLRAEAFTPLRVRLDETSARLERVEKVAEAEPLRAQIDTTAEGLDLLSEVVANLQIEDATQRTTILEGISEVFAHVNRVRAQVEARHRQLALHEGKAEFGAQFKLLGQSVAGALARSDTPERCDDELARVMVQLEELEARFSDLDEFLGDLAGKREEVYEAFSAKKLALVDERQRRAQSLIQAGQRILDGVARRAGALEDADTVNGYFASDAMVLKLRQLSEQLGELGDSVKADEILTRLMSARQDALRGLRDRKELYEEGENVIKLGTHRFNVNTQPLELAIVPQGEQMALHLGGTDFYDTVEDAAFLETRPFWNQERVSETEQVYRSEYLAASILFEAESGKQGLTIRDLLEDLRSEGGLQTRVTSLAQDRYEEGYERGIHDVDATLILEALLSMRERAGLLRFAGADRAAAVLFWVWQPEQRQRQRWQLQARSFGRLRDSLADDQGLTGLAADLGAHLRAFCDAQELSSVDPSRAAEYLVEELAVEHPRFVLSGDAQRLSEALRADLEMRGQRAAFEEELRVQDDSLGDQLSHARTWVVAFARQKHPEWSHVAFEAAAHLCDRKLEREVASAVIDSERSGLLGHHPRIQQGKLQIRLDELLSRVGSFARERVPAYRAYRSLRRELIAVERARLRLEELTPRVMTTFVRNKLINDVYLPLVGDNLAKQIGALGASKRTDLMGLLLLISPPGYGKTTLMEYIANRLGLIFVKVNGPSLGHAVHSLDPGEAPNATARQEVEKINLALEMGNNVMLYLDDIQHTHPELLQKFISLCDAQRRIEGVWKGRTRTYDLRGKKFCVVMAGNPYTESGEKFRVPDMLANRADIYNLGDVLHGREEAFALSYVENALTSNSTLAPLATREQSDVYKLVRMAKGEQIPTTELSHGYSALELGDILGTLRHLFQCQRVLLSINQNYILSAAQEERFRTEPPFKLQGSYRNMNKLAEKIVPAMTEAEVDALLDDHYLGEAQTLTSEAEQNLLKLAELRGKLEGVPAQRWKQIKDEFVRQRRAGGGDDDPVTRVTGSLGGVSAELAGIREVLSSMGLAPQEPDV